MVAPGVRNGPDWLHEHQLAAMNQAMGITTLLLPARPGLAGAARQQAIFDGYAARLRELHHPRRHPAGPGQGQPRRDDQSLVVRRPLLGLGHQRTGGLLRTVHT